ncbi:MAG: cysteine--tRNA ligase, partial [bacterium]
MTPISLHNTLSGKKEKFEPLVAGHVGMYQCGPTVYDTAHIGNLRTFVFDDIVRRVFEYRGFAVTQVMNITDVDDKTIRRSGEEGISLAELTSKYEALFLADIDTLNILRPHHILSARAHVPDMIAMISTLLERGVAYVAKDGVYLSINKVKNYGALAKLKIGKSAEEGTDADIDANAKVHERIANDEYDKENPRDFAVWKFSEDQDVKNAKEISWDAPFGRGRPGWHIECSAMATKALGDTLDIHTGGSDLVF